MDIISHVLYGVTFCSRSGIPGAARPGPRTRFSRDWTVLAALVFTILPDLVSLGVPFAEFIAGGMKGNFFAELPPERLEVYRYMHSLITALAACAISFVVFRPMFLPSLAWPLHILMDSLSHDLGKFRTTLFYPLTDWAYEGAAYWRHPWVIPASWAIISLIIIALVIINYRRSGRDHP